MNLPHRSHADLADTPVPDAFDWRDTRPNAITPPQQQGQCGSCWSFATTQSLADRYAIANNTHAVVISNEYVRDCAWNALSATYLSAGSAVQRYITPNTEYGMCTTGGFGELGARFLEKYGAPAASTYPYPNSASTGTESSLPLCETPRGTIWRASPNSTGSLCLDVDGRHDPVTSYIERPFGTVPNYPQHVIDANCLNIQRDIMRYGPVYVSYICYSDQVSSSFHESDYTDGVYRRKHDATSDGGHAVTIVGWGVTSAGTKYWIVRNSWGTEWNKSGASGAGYWRHLRGSNEGGIESAAISILPAGTSAVATAIPSSTKGTTARSDDESDKSLSSMQRFGIIGAIAAGGVLLLVLFIFALTRTRRTSQ